MGVQYIDPRVAPRAWQGNGEDKEKHLAPVRSMEREKRCRPIHLYVMMSEEKLELI